jgi:hypothetical protein
MVMAWSGWSRLAFVLFISLGAIGCVGERLGPAPTTLGQEIERLTEAPTRVVWVQDIGDQRDVLAHGTDLRLMGLDSREEGGARVLLDTPRSKAKPMFTANGDWVVFSDRNEKRMYAVHWDGQKILDLGPGFAMATWRDPGTGTEWLYFAREPREHGMPTHNSLWRYPLMEPGEQEPREYSSAVEAREELVWDQTPVSEDNFQISADGRFGQRGFPLAARRCTGFRIRPVAPACARLLGRDVSQRRESVLGLRQPPPERQHVPALAPMNSGW